MKIFTVSLLSAMVLTTSAMAISLPSVNSINPNETKLKACMLQQAQDSLSKGTLNKDNMEAQAAKIAASCAAKNALKNDDATVQLSIAVIKTLLK